MRSSIKPCLLFNNEFSVSSGQDYSSSSSCITQISLYMPSCRITELMQLLNLFQELRSATAAERGCVAAWRGEGNKIQTSAGLAVSSPGNMLFRSSNVLFFVFFQLSLTTYHVIGKVNSPASSENNSGISFQNDAQSNIPDSKAVNSSPNEEFPGFANPDEVKQSGIRSFHNKEKLDYFVSFR